MLTKEERAAIAERANECVEVCGSLYEVLLGYPSACNTTYEEDMKKLLARIIDLCDTSNMIELPSDKDGEAIHIGDTVYACDKEWKVSCVKYSDDSSIISVYSDKGCTAYYPDDLTHKKTVTIESLVERFRRVLNKSRMPAWSMAELINIADQLESLGDSDD